MYVGWPDGPIHPIVLVKLNITKEIYKDSDWVYMVTEYRIDPTLLAVWAICPMM